MNSTEIIREVCDAVRKRAAPDHLEDIIKILLVDTPAEKRDNLRTQINNAMDAVRREMKKVTEVDLSHLSRKPPKEKKS